MTFLMFIGEYFCMPLIPFIKPPTEITPEEKAKKHAPSYVFMLPALLDFTASTFISYGVIFVSASLS